jgi:hypothetical protein
MPTISRFAGRFASTPPSLRLSPLLWRPAVVVAMAALAVLVTAGLPAAASAGAASNGQIAVVATDSTAGLSAITLIPSDRLAINGDSKVLVSGPGTIGNLQWTPDGKTLVYDETAGKRTDLYAIDVASPKRRLLAVNLPYGSDGALSPDGEHGRLLERERPFGGCLPGRDGCSIASQADWRVRPGVVLGWQPPRAPDANGGTRDDRGGRLRGRSRWDSSAERGSSPRWHGRPTARAFSS